MTTPEAQPRWLSEDDRDTWVVLASLLIWLPTALDNQLQRDTDLSHFDYVILAALSESEEDTLRMSDLAIYANLTLSRLSPALARLERLRWVNRRPDQAYRRLTLA